MSLGKDVNKDVQKVIGLRGLFMSANEYTGRSKENIRIARVASGYKSAKSLADTLTKAGFSVSQSAISRYENPGGTMPSWEYLMGLHLLTGVSLDVLCGKLEWGDSGFSPTDSQADEIYRMLVNLSDKMKNIAETQIAVLYNFDKADSIAELRRSLGLGPESD